ncbi:MAG: F0F1 ATP synthase subunit delta [Candidatus Magasanikbacteria bacterium]|nr:F0F1 ATP synthase subunit delta [Candidatus Magasanikbacteria bacterium]
MKKGKGNKFYAKVLVEALKDLKPGQTKEVIKNFVLFLVKEHKIKKADQIIKEFEKYAKLAEGVQRAKIILAKKTDEKIVEKIKSLSLGKIEEEIIIDEEILGGFIFQTDDTIIDASLKTQLQKLKKSFN